MNDKRIIKEEQLNERDKNVMNEAIDNFYNEHYGEKADERIEEELKNDPNLIQVDGKWYDKRFLKNN